MTKSDEKKAQLIKMIQDDDIQIDVIEMNAEMGEQAGRYGEKNFCPTGKRTITFTSISGTQREKYNKWRITGEE